MWCSISHGDQTSRHDKWPTHILHFLQVLRCREEDSCDPVLLLKCWTGPLNVTQQHAWKYPQCSEMCQWRLNGFTFLSSLSLFLYFCHTFFCFVLRFSLFLKFFFCVLPWFLSLHPFSFSIFLFMISSLPLLIASFLISFLSCGMRAREEERKKKRNRSRERERKREKERALTKEKVKERESERKRKKEGE